MLKWITSVLAVLVLIGATVLFALLHRRSLIHASVIDGMNALKVAYSDYSARGYLTNHPTSGWRIWPFTNVVTIGGIQHQCFAEVGGGYGYGLCTLAMTTNQIFIWMDPEGTPKIITTTNTPALFSGRYSAWQPS